jgi:4-hydroxybenzoate polyprenyltransferase
MKLVDTLILSAAVALFIIGVHQLFVLSEVGMMTAIMGSYWLFMLVAGLLFWYRLRRAKEKNMDNQQNIISDNKTKVSQTSKNKQRKKK